MLIILLVLSIWATQISKPGSRIQGCLQGCAGALPKDPLRLRLISLNMLHGYPGFPYLTQRLELIAAQLKGLDADIILLQEVPRRLRSGSSVAYLAQQLRMNYAYMRANGNLWAIGFEEGEAILSRYPLSDPAWVELQPQAGFFEHRIALYLQSETPWGPLDLFVTHLTDGADEINAAQFGALEDFVQEKEMGMGILAGDLNTREDSLPIQTISQSWVDVYRSYSPDDTGNTCCVEVTHPTRQQRAGERIDYLFIIPSSEQQYLIRNARVVLNGPELYNGIWLWPSDHFGVLADLSVIAPANDATSQ